MIRALFMWYNIHTIRALYIWLGHLPTGDRLLCVFIYKSLNLIAHLMLPLVFLSDIVLNFVLPVQVILGGFPRFNGYHHWHQSCGAGNTSECWLIRIRWHLKVAGRDKAQTKQSAQQFTLHTNAALAVWTSNELQITDKVTSSLSLASSAEDKESLQGAAEKTQEEAGKVFH